MMASRLALRTSFIKTTELSIRVLVQNVVVKRISLNEVRAFLFSLKWQDFSCCFFIYKNKVCFDPVLY